MKWPLSRREQIKEPVDLEAGVNIEALVNIEKIEIREYARDNGRELIVRSYEGVDNALKFTVSFDGGCTVDGNAMLGEFGLGRSVDEALIQYAKKISHKRMNFDIFNKHRIDILLPKFVHTHKLGM